MAKCAVTAAKCTVKRQNVMKWPNAQLKWLNDSVCRFLSLSGGFVGTCVENGILSDSRKKSFFSPS